ncbi:Cytochrome c2 [Defluviimonas aquaemixtae]|uniref:Cytochrome c2 n=1 Tax=Albidovulum aquaemixtae TaxID=1542388 RepID=A0A2R8B1P8_9RHOB|nr:c-type cytochrome [Defluviimonas aquaemixtae]SPH16564.1 Cytochrome c2 [Defluviimonas aquaemixtae]
MSGRGFVTCLALSLAFCGALGGRSAPAAEIGDAERGAEIWGECSGCHAIGPEAEHSIGPKLNGIFGRRAASHDDFRYSKSLTRAGRDGLTWTLETLDAYIANPRTFASGTRMSYPGLRDAAERADLLAFLRDFSDKPRDIPEAEPTARRTLPELPADVLALKGDPEFGEYLASECKTCHRADGADEGIPSITLWPEEDFVLAMHAYKQKLRPHPVMQMMSGRLSEEEIAALAAYFAALTE